MEELRTVSKVLLACVLALFVVTSQAVAVTLLSDDFNDGNDDGWVKTDPQFYSVAGGEYLIDNYGGGTTYALRPDVTLPSNWVFTVDMKMWRLYTHNSYAGVGIVENPSNPWSNYINVNMAIHAPLNLMGLQIHWQYGATPIDWVPYNPGDQVRLTVSRAEGSNVLSAVLTGPGGTLSATSIDLSGKLAVTRTPALQGSGESYSAFDNVLITAIPEPSTLLSLAVGAMGLAGFALRRKR